MSNLDFVDFQNNAFTGTLPSSIFDAPNVRIMYFSNNNFEGPIPNNYGNPPLLRDLYLDRNQLTGTVPPTVAGQLAELTEFLLQENQLTGTMPASICALPILEDLWADCGSGSGGARPEIVCSCCTQCFSSGG